MAWLVWLIIVSLAVLTGFGLWALGYYHGTRDAVWRCNACPRRAR